jgi:hypothetical protein
LQIQLLSRICGKETDKLGVSSTYELQAF